MRSTSYCNSLASIASGFLLCLASAGSAADSYIDRVYHPYVEVLETEIEWRTSRLDKDTTTGRSASVHKLGMGKSVTERLFLETYVLAEQQDDRSFAVEGFEFEAKYQLTEQGEFWADWGALLEVERETGNNVWEVATALLIEKEFGQTSLAANIRLIYEFGGGINNEFETQGAVQWRLRGRPLFEPAIELYAGQNANGIGPMVGGMVRFNRSKLKYELGTIIGMDRETPDTTWRFMLEYEF